MEWRVFSLTARPVTLSLLIKFLKYFSLLCTLTWRVNNYVPRQEKVINKRNESTNNFV